jgi:hypothetical protein
MTFVIDGLPNVQLILKRSSNIAEVLNNFDLDCVQIGLQKVRLLL